MVALRDPVERRTRPRGEPALGERVERYEGDPGIGADVDQGVGGAVAQIVGVLDREDLGYTSRARKLGSRDVGYADVADLAFALKLDEGADRIFDRHAVIDGMKLVELDPVEPQPLQALRADPAQVFGPAVHLPMTRA